MADHVAPKPSADHPITEVSVTELSVETTGALPAPSRRSSGTPWSTSSLWSGIVSLALAPVFGLGALTAIVSIIVGHHAKRVEPQGLLKWGAGLGVSYVALVVGTAVLVFVALPLTLAFLISTGYILAD
jgi:hypothetical protein